MKPQHIVVALVVALLLGFFWIQQLLAVETSCDDLAAAAGGVAEALLDPETVEHTLVIEVAGNTDGWTADATEFVGDRLTASGEMAPQAPMVVRVSLVVNGETHQASTECLQRSLVLNPPENDKHAYDNGSDATREQMLESMRLRRADQIAEIAQVVADEIEGLDLESIGADASVSTVEGGEGRADTGGLAISPFTPWATAARSGEGDLDANRRWVSVLSVLHSNAGDCFDTSTSENDDLTAEDLVAGCVDYGGLPTIGAGHVFVDYPAIVARSPGQQQRAEEMVEALCQSATSSGTCDVPGQDDSDASAPAPAAG